MMSKYPSMQSLSHEGSEMYPGRAEDSESEIVPTSYTGSKGKLSESRSVHSEE